MPLRTGARLGSYEVLSPIGAGGMGEVYRARDVRLDRDVAIKVLPEAFAADADRLARFEREARTLAALNHPNIATVFGVTEGGTAHGLVMEFVPGEDLSALIARGPVPVAEALPIARQIAEALEAAHEQGIIHRDLKPANIKIRPDGTVKVLDFGLAKALDPSASAGADAMNSPTLTARATQMGMVLGTAAYMAPEQARGKAVDRRADIWAFGVVLYEMLAGRRAFQGDDVSITLAGVLKDDVDWTALPPDVPASVRRLLGRCLEKDPRRRLSAIADARLDLDEADAAPPPVVAPRVVPESVRGWSGVRVAVALSACALGVAGLTWLVATALAPGPSSLVTRSSILAPDNTTLYVDASSVTLSPDGRLVALVTGDIYGNGTRLWVRRLGGLVVEAVPGTDGAQQPFWSPDSRQIGFFTKDKLQSVPVDGGRIQEICDVQDARGGAWGAQNVIVFAPANAGPLMKVAATGGTPTPATTLDTSRAETGHRFPSFLPDGDHFLYAALPAHAGSFDVFIGSVRGAPATYLTKAESAPVFASAGFLLFEQRSGLRAQPFDAVRRVVTGDPQPLEDLPGGVSAQYFGNHAVSVSTTGTMAYLSAPPINTGLAWFDVSGRETGRVALPAAPYESVALSPDGRRAIAERRTGPAVADLWTIDLVRGGATRLTNATGVNFNPVWSPDNQRIAYSSDREGPEWLFLASPNSAGSDEVLFKSPSLFKQPQSWSPDGKYVVYTDASPVTNLDLWVIPVDGARQPMPYLRSPANESAGQISPDGRWMAYLSDETGQYEAYVQAFPTPRDKFRLTTSGSNGVWWRKDSKQLLIVSNDLSTLFESDVEAGPAFSATAPKVVGHLPKGLQFIDVSPDLQRLLALRIEGGNASMSVTIVQNWPSAMGKGK